MKTSYKQIKTPLIGFLCAVLQCCTHDAPSPLQPSSGKLAVDSKASSIITIKEKYRKDPFKNDSEKGDGTASKLMYVCENIYYVGYDVNSGEQVFHDYIGRECTPFDDGTGNGGGTGGSTGSDGGGGGSTGGSGSTSNGSYSDTPTTDRANQKPPADCNSWLFRKVGPSGYMACGVRDVNIDIWHNFIDGQGRIGSYYFNFTFNTYTLYFEMPPSYTPGEASTVCAELKDQAERFIENKYGSNEPLNADVIANAYYARLSSLMQSAGGRLAKTANYPNTPVGEYQETLGLDNGDCH